MPVSLCLIKIVMLFTILETVLSQKVCDGNHFKFISTYVLGRQNDLTLTFAEMEPQVHV